MKKKLISILLMLTLIVSLISALSISASASPPTSGNCGVKGENDDSVKWRVEERDTIGYYTLVFSGKGEMEGFAFWAADRGRYAPWWDWHDKIDGVVIEDGITNIGRNALRELSNLKTLEIPGSVKRIDYCGVYNCQNLKKVIMHEGLETIGEYAFEYDYALEEIVFPSTLKSIGYEAFYEDNNIKTVWYYGDSWSNVTVDKYNNTLPVGSIKSKNQIIDYSKWYSDKNDHWRESISSAPVKVVDSKGTHYDNTGDELCDVCGRGMGLTSLTYIDKDGNTVNISDKAIQLASNTPVKGGQFLLLGETLIDSRIEVTGDSEFIILDGSYTEIGGGIHVAPGVTLTIYSESLDPAGMGTIILSQKRALRSEAGIGTNKNEKNYNTRIVICGGNISSTAPDDGAGIGSGEGGYCRVDIYNGIVTANGGMHAAGIGSGYWGDCTVNIYDGTVIAHGGESGTGIGSGANGSARVYISASASVEAYGGRYADDINSLSNSPVGFTLSGGNIWIVIAGAVVILGGVAAIMIVSKKKKKAAV